MIPSPRWPINEWVSRERQEHAVAMEMAEAFAELLSPYVIARINAAAEGRA